MRGLLLKCVLCQVKLRFTKHILHQSHFFWDWPSSSISYLRSYLGILLKNSSKTPILTVIYFVFEVRKVNYLDHMKFISWRKWCKRRFGVAETRGKIEFIDSSEEIECFLLYFCVLRQRSDGSLIFLNAQILLPTFRHNDIFTSSLFVLRFEIFYRFCLFL